MTQAATMDDPVLAEIVRRIVEAVDPDKVVLFGSRARGQAEPGSDYDIVIIAPSDRPPGRRAGRLYLDLGDLHVPKDVLWWTPEEAAEWRNVRSHFITTALREGRVVYERAA